MGLKPITLGLTVPHTTNWLASILMYTYLCAHFVATNEVVPQLRIALDPSEHLDILLGFFWSDGRDQEGGREGEREGG